MITIGNKYITVDILDPVDDSVKTGSRYCTGGYVWQVYDKNGRSLLSGPKYPDKTPPVFDGQGMPEAFETPLGGGDGAAGSDVCVIGVGTVRKSSEIEPFHPRDNPEVVRPCEWDIECGGDKVMMTTEQTFGDKSIRLRREIQIISSRVQSTNVLYNIGRDDIDIRWFAHPFFPLNSDFSCGKITPSVSLPDSAGYEMGEDGMIRMKRDYKWPDGLFQELDMTPQKLAFAIPHPVVGKVIIHTTYRVTRCPIWANGNTFSFEPFMEGAIKSGERLFWETEYNFLV